MSQAQFKWWFAQINLAYRSVLHYLKMVLFWRRRKGYVQFRENYVAEGLPAWSLAGRKIAHFAGQCTTCGLCDAACPSLLPMRLVMSGMRGGPLLNAVEPQLARLADAACMDCRQCEQACPQQIPIVALASELQTQWREINEL